MKACWLTTFDNPWDPFNQFREWFVHDMVKGHNSSGLLARIARTSDALSDEENRIERERAIDRIVALDFTNTYKKVIKEIDEDE